MKFVSRIDAFETCNAIKAKTGIFGGLCTPKMFWAPPIFRRLQQSCLRDHWPDTYFAVLMFRMFAINVIACMVSIVGLILTTKEKNLHAMSFYKCLLKYDLKKVLSKNGITREKTS